MNKVVLMGRLTSDPQVAEKYARFNLAVPAGKDKDGNELTDFPQVVCYGNQIKFVQNGLEKGWLTKGKAIIVEGQIKTSKREVDGQTVYNTYVRADNFAFPLQNSQGQAVKQEAPAEAPKETQADAFAAIEEDVPF